LSHQKPEVMKWKLAMAMFALFFTPMLAYADSTHVAIGPVTNWSYGWKNTPTGDFTLFQGRFTFVGLPAWYSGTQGYPYAVFNNTNKAAVVSGKDFRLPRNQIMLHPSNDGRLAAVRWVAESSGAYQIQGLFEGLETCGYRSVYVVVNSAVVFKQTNSGTAVNPFSFQYDLTAGNTVDFEVDDGGNQYYCDGVGLSALITDL
jgi:hypothetical protein